MTSNDKEIQRLLKERGISTWLRTSLKCALQRCPTDAANDADVLFAVLEKRAMEARDKSFGFTRNPI